MATVTHAISTESTANSATYSSGAFTPALNDLLVVFAAVTGSVTAVPTLATSLGVSFDHAGSIRHNANEISGVDRLHLFVSSALVAASSQTVDLNLGGDSGTGCILHVARVAGMTRTGLLAILQSKFAQADGDPVTVAFDAACLTGNPTLACIQQDNSPAAAAPSGWTRGDTKSISTPTCASAYDFRNSGFTGTDITWGAGSINDYGAVIVELDTSAAPSGGESFELGFW